MNETARRDYFISYSRKDLRFAKRLQRALEAAGKTVWRDETEIPGGGDFQEAIRTNLRKAETVLVILSPQSARSDYVMGEAEMALEMPDKHVIPILHEKLPSNHNVPIKLMGRNQIDFRYAFKAGLKALIERRPVLPPPWYVRLLRKTGTKIPAGALVVVLAGVIAYQLRPSTTSATLVDRREAGAIYVLLENSGGRSSFVTGPYLLNFGELPVVDTSLERADEAGNVVPRNSRLIMTLKKRSGFTPKTLPDGTWLTAQQIGDLTPKYKVSLKVGVKESDGKSGPPPMVFAAAAIRTFLETGLPTIGGIDAH